METNYLDRPLLNVTYNIGEDYATIQSENTSFVNIRKMYFNPENVHKELISSLKRLKNAAKEKGYALIGTRKVSKWIEGFIPRYSEAVRKYNDDFSKIMEISREMEKRGIHRGYSDDTKVGELSKYEWEIAKAFFSHKPLGLYNDAMRSMSRILKTINGEGGLKFPKDKKIDVSSFIPKEYNIF